MNIDERILFNFISGHEPSGESAYDIWKSLGNEGDADEFLEFLRTGESGANGKSAYQIAVEAGYKGTEAEFCEKLAKTAVTIDDTLSVTGQAADAKITGDKINSINKELEKCLKEGDSVKVEIATEEQAIEATDDTVVMVIENHILRDFIFSFVYYNSRRTAPWAVPYGFLFAFRICFIGCIIQCLKTVFFYNFIQYGFLVFSLIII